MNTPPPRLPPKPTKRANFGLHFPGSARRENVFLLMIRWREVNVFVLSVIASVVSRCFSAFCRRAPAATKKAGRYSTKAAGFRRPVAAFLRVPRAPSVGQACPSARVPLDVGGRCRRFARCAEAARAAPRWGAALLGPARSPPRKTPRLNREKVQAGCVLSWAQACRRSEASVPRVRSAGLCRRGRRVRHPEGA